MIEFSPPFHPTLTELLDLEELDRDLYRGINEYPANDHPNLYGGQVAAQALRAAGLTVPEGRHAHSMHGYFLRAGRRAQPVVFQVERDRDGRSFSSRRVSAIQDGEVIFDLAASFHVDRAGAVHDMAMRRDLVPPQDCEPEPFNHNFPNCEARLVPPIRVTDRGQNVSPTVWVRTKEPLTDRLAHACALVYMSDISSGFAGPDTDHIPIRAASLDHSMWFQNPIRADQWVLLDMSPMMAGGARGLYSGAMHAIDGTLGSMLTQQMLFVE